MKKLLSVFLIVSLLLLAGCEKEEDGTSSFQTQDSSSSADPVEVDFSKTEVDMFTERDGKTDFDEEQAITVKLSGNSASASSDSVKISGSKITITKEATYIVSGELSDGMLIVDAPDTAKPQIILSGANITSKTSAALYILEADKVFVTLAEGSVNTLSNGGSFTAIDDSNIDAAVFSKQDLTLNGSGALTVTSPAGHGVVCKDDLVITSGSYTVTSASHGIDANDSVRITNASLTIDAGKDGIHSENSDDASLGFIFIKGGTIKAEAEGDGISAGSYMQISGGAVELLAGGGSENGSKEHSDSFGGFMGGGHGGRPGGMRTSEAKTDTTEASTSMKGLKAVSTLLISGGSFSINSADDSIHSDASVIINGGTFTISSGDDAIHAEDTLTVTAGKIEIRDSYEGLEALNIDVRGGDIKLKSSDDGLNAAGGTDQSGTEGGRDGMFGGMGGHGGMSANSNGSIKISGGTLYINSSGDGIDANGTLEISGGSITVVGPTQGDTATLDYDKSATISGGTFIGTGAQGMAQTFSDSSQGVISVSVGNQSAGTTIMLKDKSGKVIVEYSPELNFAVIILSSPDIKKGETYTVSVGSESAEFAAN